jgi:hypothetical protein
VSDHAEPQGSGREDESVVVVTFVNLETFPWVLLHVDRRLNHVSIGIQEVITHQQCEVFRWLHLKIDHTVSVGHAVTELPFQNRGNVFQWYLHIYLLTRWRHNQTGSNMWA